MFGRRKRNSELIKKIKTAKEVVRQTENERCPIKGCTKKRNHPGSKHE